MLNYDILNKYKSLNYKQLYKKNYGDNINLRKSKIKLNLHLFLFLFLNNINYKKNKNKILKKKNILYFEHLKYSYVNELLKKLNDVTYYTKNIKKYGDLKKKKILISYKNRCSLYSI
jgi:hypothetical protein